MSRIQSIAQRATKTLTQASEDVKREVKRSSALHDAGAPKPGRETREVREWRGLRSEVSGTDSFGEYGDRRFLGVEGRVFAQRSPSVGSLGGDAFVGARTEQYDSSRRTTAMVGAEGHAAAFVGAVNGVRAGATAGVQVTEKTTTREGDAKTEQTAHLLYGAVAEAQVQVGTVTGGKLDLFVGARGGQDQRLAVTNPDGSERGGLGVRGRGMVGVGVMVDGEAGYDVEHRQARVSLGAGAAVGVGLYGGGEVTVGGEE
ncbi:MAG: hypothetical protein ACOZQL_34810 [Myxococcota bacterium]